ncbi:MAG: YCF48-related protein [Planctomycetota bacterium]
MPLDRLAALCCAALLGAVPAPGGGALASQPTRSLYETLVDDASLHDVQMIDARRGWSVGDHGVVLATDDGGAHWRVQPTPTRDRIGAVSFVDSRLGWAVGGHVQPHTRQSRAMVLRTTNGGRSWEPVPQRTLPALQAVRFFDDRRGAAAGVGSAFAPSGVFLTDDGGRSWRTLGSDASGAWRGGAFWRNGRRTMAVLAGERGAVGAAEGLQVRGDSLAVNGQPAEMRAAAWTPQTGVWLAGDEGAVFTTPAPGGAWRRVETPVRADWRALEAKRGHIWLAGLPGSVVLRSADGGASWTEHPTGVSTPLNAISFVDENHGVAVGDFGVIVTTDDGGRTWRPRRGGDRRASVLWLLTDETEAAPELLATTALAGGRRTVVVNATHDSLACLAEAAHRLGAAATHRLGGGSRAAARLRTLVAAYAPSVVVLPTTESRAESTRDRVQELLAEAVPSHASDGLRQVLIVTPSAPGARIAGAVPGRFATGDFLPGLGSTAEQWTAEARGLLRGDATAPDAYRWTAMSGRAPPGRRGDLGDATATPRGGPDRRELAAAPAGRIETLRRLAQRRRQIARLLSEGRGGERWASDVMDLTSGLSAPAGAPLLERLARGYWELGKADLTAEARYLLARRYPGEPLADAALEWLLRYYASTECGIAARQKPGGKPSVTLANVPPTATPRLTPPPGEQELTDAARIERALKLAGFLEAERPALAAEPGLRTVAAAAKRRADRQEEANRSALVLTHSSVAAPWRRAAAAERWLIDAKSLPPDKPIVTCRATDERPTLDGAFTEPCWQAAEHAELPASLADSTSTSLRFCRDEEFLYVAIDAQTSVPPTDAPSRRRRDADLRRHDRVRIRIDVDRDYTTAFQLGVDCRGFTNDSAWGDPTWRPDWYVARAASDGRWRVEAAIALDSLSSVPEDDHATWALAIERVSPEGDSGSSAGSVSWTGRADGTPDSFGLLLLR